MILCDINKIELNYSAHEAYLFRANLQTSVCLAGSTGCGAIMCICTFTDPTENLRALNGFRWVP